MVNLRNYSTLWLVTPSNKTKSTEILNYRKFMSPSVRSTITLQAVHLSWYLHAPRNRESELRKRCMYSRAGVYTCKCMYTYKKILLKIAIQKKLYQQTTKERDRLATEDIQLNLHEFKAVYTVALKPATGKALFLIEAPFWRTNSPAYQQISVHLLCIKSTCLLSHKTLRTFCAHFNASSVRNVLQLLKVRHVVVYN